MTTKIRLLHDTVGIPTGAVAVTQSASDNTTKVATTAYVTTALANLADSAPSTLNTLNELAAALGDDANFSTTVTNSIATKAPLANPTFTGTLTLPGSTAGTRTIKDSYSSGALANQGFLRSSGGNYWAYSAYQDGSANWKSAVSVAAERSVYAIDEDTAYWSHAPSQTVSIGSDLTTQPTKKVVFDLENGRVGIGESNPDAPLHITSNTPIISFDESDASQEFRLGSFGGAFALYDSTDSAYRLVVDGSGNVGIGTTSPNKTLDVEAPSGTATVANFRNPNGGWGQYAKARFQTDAKDTRFIELGYYRGTQESERAFCIDGQSSNRLLTIIEPTGNVGIGTDSPLVKLDVRGSASAPATSGTAQTGSLRVSQTVGNGVLDMGFYTSSNGTAWLQSTNKSNLATNYDIALQPNGGKVGIGTASPNAPLEINGGVGMTGGWGRSMVLRHNFPTLVFQSEYSTDAHAGIAYDNTTGMKFMVNSPTIDIFANSQTPALTILDNKNVGIGGANPQALFDVTVPNAKTANAGVWGYLGKTNESSGYQALQCFQIGGSAADERRYEFQTIEQGASNDGIIVLQKSGGRVFVGHDNADGNSDKLVVSGSIGISNDGLIGAGSGFGPSNGAGSSSSIQLYSSSTGNMTLSANYSAADTVFNMSGNTKFVVKRSAAGTEAIQLYTNDGGIRIGALNSAYHHIMRLSGPSIYYFDNPAQASGGFSTYSDERLKEEITLVTGALDSVAKMNGVTFKWKDAAKRGGGDTGKQFGVLAQNMLEIDSALPTLNVDPLETQENIDDASKDTDYYSMDYSRITPFLIEAIKELKTKLEAAEARITTLEG